MGIGQTNDITEKDSVVKLLQSGILNQGNLNGKIGHTGVISLSEDNTVKLYRSKRNIGIVNVILFITRLVSNPRGWQWGIRVGTRYLGTRRGQEKAIDTGRDALGDVEVLEKLKDLVNRFHNNSKAPQETTTQSSQTIKQLNLELINAVKQSNLDKVKEYVNKGANVETKDSNGSTALHIAAKSGNLDITRFLLDKGADFNAQDSLGFMPLHLAVEHGHLDIVKSLVEKGADVDAYQGGYSYSTALHLAAQKGHLDVIKYLIEKGANHKATDRDGKTPMLRAIQNGHLDVSGYLMETEEQQVTTNAQQVTKGQQITEVTEVNDNKVPQETATQISTVGTSEKHVTESYSKAPQEFTTQISTVGTSERHITESYSKVPQEITTQISTTELNDSKTPQEATTQMSTVGASQQQTTELNDNKTPQGQISTKEQPVTEEPPKSLVQEIWKFISDLLPKSRDGLLIESYSKMPQEITTQMSTARTSAKQVTGEQRVTEVNGINTPQEATTQMSTVRTSVKLITEKQRTTERQQ
ncbi:MAG: ankyrin repeat domain-containing protein [Wolbachia endosymbiont of Tyrophagus putrescentiae]|nr:ankyrin repeat domain-containing protein [Wolbachia endosymbiont of Tyrophagus putrescentiae]